MHSTFQKDPERFTKVSVANRHLVITTIKGKIMVIYNYKDLLDSMDPRQLDQFQRAAILRNHMMVISTDSNVLDLSTYGNKVGIRLSNGFHTRREDFLLFLDAGYLPDLNDTLHQVHLKCWAIISPINRYVLGCGKECGGMVIDDFGICLPGVQKCKKLRERRADPQTTSSSTGVRSSDGGFDFLSEIRRSFITRRGLLLRSVLRQVVNVCEPWHVM